MSDTPTDDVEELEAFEVDDDEEEVEVAPPVAERPAQAKRGARNPKVTPAEAEEAESARPLEFLHNVEMDVTVELGRAKRTVRDLLEVQLGSVIELDRSAGSPVDVLVNGRLIARGEVVVVDDEFAVRITEVLDTSGERVNR